MSSSSKVIAITSAAVTAQGKKNKLELAKALVAAKGVKGLDNVRGETDVDMDADSNVYPTSATQWMGEEMGKGRGSAGVVLNFLQEFKHAGSTLTARVTKSFATSDGIPKTKELWGNVFAEYVDEDDAKLIEDPTGGVRNEGQHLVSFTSVAGAWPPPISSPFDDESASNAWEVRVPEGKINDVYDCGSIRKALNLSENAVVRMYRRYFANGKPSEIWVLRAEYSDGAIKGDFTIGEGDAKRTFEFKPRCALCLKGPPFADYHDHSQCPLLSTWNKFREQAGVVPAKVSPGGWLEAPRENVATDYSKDIKALYAANDALDKRLQKLERAAGIAAKKRKAEDEGVKPDGKVKTPKKRKGSGKADTAAGPSSAKGKGKQKAT